jgi:putative spermidine/putrescine transport system permease protein
MISLLLVRLLAWMTLFYLLLPLVVIVGTSLTSTSFLAFPPRGITMAWYVQVLRDDSYLAAFATSTWLAVLATAIATFLAVPAALGLARNRFPGKSALLAFFMSPLALPHIVLGTALLQYVAALGIMRTFAALLIGHVVVVAPFVLRSVLPQITPHTLVLEDAAADLGAGQIQRFFLITYPQIRSGIFSGAILAFISSWINVEISIFNTSSTMTTIPVKLFNYAQYTIDPILAAVSSITILISAVLVILIEITVGMNLLSVDRGK